MTKAQVERLVLLIEEMGESIQAASKILRHGFESAGYDNRGQLEKELGHVLFAISLLSSSADIDTGKITESQIAKAKSIAPYLHHQIGIES